MVNYEQITQDLVKSITDFTFEFTFDKVKSKMELREVPEKVLTELGEKKTMENFINKVFYMRLSDGKVIDVNSFNDFTQKNNIKDGSTIMFNFKYVRWEIIEDLTTPQIKNHIKRQLTNNNDIDLEEVQKAFISEELKSKQIYGYLGDLPIISSTSIEQGKFYMHSTCPPEQAYKLINETIKELQEKKKDFIDKKIKRDKKNACWYVIFIVLISILWLINHSYSDILPTIWVSLIAFILFVAGFVIVRFINYSNILKHIL